MAEVKNTVFTLPATLPVVRHQLKFDSYIQKNHTKVNHVRQG